MAKTFFACETFNNRLHAVLLSIATIGYRIQSQSLHIPDRFGFFSSGPPRLQVQEAKSFIELVSFISFQVVSVGVSLFVARRFGTSNGLSVACNAVWVNCWACGYVPGLRVLQGWLRTRV